VSEPKLQSAPHLSGDPEWGQTISDAVALIFSWVLLMPISVVVGGKLLAHNLGVPISEVDADFFDIRIPLFIRIRATRSQVILGFTSFIITFLFLGFCAGKVIYEHFKDNFGINPGQWNSLCITSAFSTVAWTFAVFLIRARRALYKRPPAYEKIISQLSLKGPGAPVDTEEITSSSEESRSSLPPTATTSSQEAASNQAPPLDTDRAAS
jgi:hypothetical protein